jgi:hypothetical protein
VQNVAPKYLIATLKKIPSPSPYNIGSGFLSEKSLQKFPKAWRGHTTNFTIVCRPFLTLLSHIIYSEMLKFPGIQIFKIHKFYEGK